MKKQIKKSRKILKKTLEEVSHYLKNDNRIVMFFDEGRFGLQSTIKRIWGIKGEKLTVRVKQGYKNFYIYSSVSPFDGESCTLFLPEVNVKMMEIYLKELSEKYCDKETLLIMDQAGWHRSEKLKVPWNIKLMFLPPYSPELNPIEKLWWWIRKEVTHNKIFKTLDDQMDAIEKEFKKLTKNDFSRLCNCTYLYHFK